ncbi:hypothetical protein VNI00_017572 [Paramarasmius palmivorus]|uniref:Uncharacterized protein n=1 Tax=Paramarasmius palmivorus TaxID=297713 RepID=A0AAW0B7Z1_9AGAR
MYHLQPVIDEYIIGGHTWVNSDQERLKVLWGREALRRGDRVNEETRELILEYDRQEASDQRAWENYCQYYFEQVHHKNKDSEEDSDGSDDAGSDATGEEQSSSEEEESITWPVKRQLKGRSRLIGEKEDEAKDHTVDGQPEAKGEESLDTDQDKEHNSKP